MTTKFTAIAALSLGLALSAFAQEDGAETPPPAPREGAGEFAGAPGGPGVRRGPGFPGGRPGKPDREGGFRPMDVARNGADRFGFIVPLLRQEGAMEKIGLDAEAAKALAETLEGFDGQIAEAEKKLPGAMKKQAEELGKDAPDEAAVVAAVNEVWDVRREVALLQTRKLLAVRSALTAEQIAAARKLLRQTWDARGQMRRGGRDGEEGGGPDRAGKPDREGRPGPRFGEGGRRRRGPPPDGDAPAGEPPAGELD